MLFDALRYPEGRVHEDVAITHKLVHEAKRIILLPYCLYHHSYRKNSIANTHTFENRRDGFVSALEKNNDLIIYGFPPNIDKTWLYSYTIGFLVTIPSPNDELYYKAKEIIDSLDYIPNRISIKQKIALIIWNLNESLFYRICRLVDIIGYM